MSLYGFDVVLSRGIPVNLEILDGQALQMREILWTTPVDDLPLTGTYRLPGNGPPDHVCFVFGFPCRRYRVQNNDFYKKRVLMINHVICTKFRRSCADCSATDRTDRFEVGLDVPVRDVISVQNIKCRQSTKSFS